MHGDKTEKKKPEIKAVLFDFDGTLADSIKAYHKAFNEGVDKMGLKQIGLKELAKMLSDGLPLREMLLKTFPSKIQRREELIRKCRENILESYIRIWSKRVQLITGTTQTLRWLSEKSIRVAVITGRALSAQQMRELLNQYEIDIFVDTIVTGGDVPNRKPAPDQIIKALKSVDVPAASSILVGDSKVDVKAGKAAGVWTVAVLTGVENRKRLEEENPDFIIESVKDIPKTPILE